MPSQISRLGLWMCLFFSLHLFWIGDLSAGDDGGHSNSIWQLSAPIFSWPVSLSKPFARFCFLGAIPPRCVEPLCAAVTNKFSQVVHVPILRFVKQRLVCMVNSSVAGHLFGHGCCAAISFESSELTAKNCCICHGGILLCPSAVGQGLLGSALPMQLVRPAPCRLIFFS